MANLKDVSKKAGVSLSTVSIVLNGKSSQRKISASTQEKVFQAARELHYQVNISAKNLKSGDSSGITIALYWSFDFRKEMMIRFFTGLQDKISKCNANASIVIHPYTSGSLCRDAAAFVSGQFHAAIIANATQEDLHFLEENKFSIPIVIYNRFSDLYSSVNINDARIGELAAEHLYQNGYASPAVIGSHSTFPGATVRRSSFYRKFQEYGVTIPENHIINIENSISGGSQFVESTDFTVLKNVDCYFCDSDTIALGIQSAMIRRGIRIPEDCGIIAVGNGLPQYAQYIYPAITTINIPMEQMAASCYDLLDRCFKEVSFHNERIFFRTELFPRDSTRHLKANDPG